MYISYDVAGGVNSQRVVMKCTPREIEPDHWLAPDPCAVSLTDLMELGIDIYQ